MAPVAQIAGCGTERKRRPGTLPVLGHTCKEGAEGTNEIGRAFLHGFPTGWTAGIVGSYGAAFSELIEGPLMLEICSRYESWLLAVRQQVAALNHVACVCPFYVMVEASEAQQSRWVVSCYRQRGAVCLFARIHAKRAGD